MLVSMVLAELPAPRGNYGPPNAAARSNSYLPPSRSIASQYGAPSKTIAIPKAQNFNSFDSQRQNSYQSAPSSNYGAPSTSSFQQAPQSNYGAPSAPQSQYGAPSAPQSQYGAPSNNQYQAPAAKYGVPSMNSYQQAPSNNDYQQAPQSNYGVPSYQDNTIGSDSYSSNQNQQQGGQGGYNYEVENFLPPIISDDLIQTSTLFLQTAATAAREVFIRVQRLGLSLGQRLRTQRGARWKPNNRKILRSFTRW